MCHRILKFYMQTLWTECNIDAYVKQTLPYTHAHPFHLLCAFVHLNTCQHVRLSPNSLGDTTKHALPPSLYGWLIDIIINDAHPLLSVISKNRCRCRSRFQQHWWMMYWGSYLWMGFFHAIQKLLACTWSFSRSTRCIINCVHAFWSPNKLTIQFYYDNCYCVLLMALLYRTLHTHAHALFGGAKPTYICSTQFGFGVNFIPLLRYRITSYSYALHTIYMDTGTQCKP